MNTAQRKLLTKAAALAGGLVLVGVSASLIHDALPAGWLGQNREMVKWSAFALFVIAAALASRSGPVPSYTDRHAALNDFYDEHRGRRSTWPAV